MESGVVDKPRGIGFFPRLKEKGFSVFFLVLLPLQAYAQLRFSIEPANGAVEVDTSTPTLVEIWVRSTASSEQKVKIVDMKWSVDFSVVEITDQNGASITALPQVRDGSSGVKDFVLLNKLDAVNNTFSYSLAFQDSNGNFVTMSTPFLYARFYLLPRISGKVALNFDTSFSGATIVDLSGKSQEATVDFQGSTFYVVPKARMNPLSSVTYSNPFFIFWDAEDSRSQTIASFDVQVSEDGINWTSQWKETADGPSIDHTGLTSKLASFYGQTGKTYQFRVRAVDKYGNMEAFPSSAETQTKIEGFYIQLLPQPDRPECLYVAVRAAESQSATPTATVTQGTTKTSLALVSTAGRTFGANYCLTASSGTAKVCVNGSTSCRSFDVITLDPLRARIWRSQKAQVFFPPQKPKTLALWETESGFGMTATAFEQPVRITLLPGKKHYVAVPKGEKTEPLQKQEGQFLAERGGAFLVLKDSQPPLLTGISASHKQLTLSFREEGSGIQKEDLQVKAAGREVAFELNHESIVVREMELAEPFEVQVKGSDRAGNPFFWKEKIWPDKAKLIEQVVITPNPSSANARLRIKSRQITSVDCAFYTTSGQKIKTAFFVVNRQKEEQVKTALPSGIYFVSCKDENGFRETFKWVVIR